MYCRDEVFREEIEFGDNKDSWQKISESICTVSKDKHERFIDKILCNAYLSKRDPIIENLLSKYDIRQENLKSKVMREKCIEKRLVSDKRKMNFPMYNMKLNRH